MVDVYGRDGSCVGKNFACRFHLELTDVTAIQTSWSSCIYFPITCRMDLFLSYAHFDSLRRKLFDDHFASEGKIEL
jgi:hypothetical protein